jgi:hypothetical protein
MDLDVVAGDHRASRRFYAEQAKDREHATDIRMRAEIRAGELLAEMKANGERVTSASTLKKGPVVAASDYGATPTLTDLGVTKSQSSRWQLGDVAALHLRIDRGHRRALRAAQAAGTKWSALVTPTAAHPPGAPLERTHAQQVFSAFLIGSDPGYFAGR